MNMCACDSCVLFFEWCVCVELGVSFYVSVWYFGCICGLLCAVCEYVRV